MTAVTSWATIICLAAVSASVLNMMSPAGNMNRIFKYVLGVFLISAVIIPISQISLSDFEFDSSIFDTDNNLTGTNEMNSVADNYMSAGVAAVIESELDYIGITPIKTEIIMDNTDISSISITKAVITIDKKDAANKQAVLNVLESKLGIKAEVYITEANNE